MKYFILIVITTIFFFVEGHAQKVKLIIDADTGNEMDDLYAISRALDKQEVELLGLISAHFNNAQLVTDSMWKEYPTEDINTLHLSQIENEQLLEDCKLINKIPHPPGCEKMVGYAWGFKHDPQIPSSAGVDFILDKAKKASPQNKLIIACIGAATNVAAAILTDSSICRNIRLYILSTYFDPATKIWDKNEFNVRNDLNAVDIIFNTPDLELYVMSAKVSGNFIFDRRKTQDKLAMYNNAVSQNLSNRWDFVEAGRNWVMWDIALIESIIHPEYATLEKCMTPPENYQREVQVFTAIDTTRMKIDFWEAYDRFMNQD